MDPINFISESPPSPKRNKVAVVETMKVCFIRFGSWTPSVIHPVVFQNNCVLFSFAASDPCNQLTLEAKDITLCQYNLKKGMPTIFFNVTHRFGVMVRERLKMVKDGRGPYFDPCGTADCEKRVIIRPMSDPTHDQATRILEAFDGMATSTNRIKSALFEELDKEKVNRLLVASSLPEHLTEKLSFPSVPDAVSLKDPTANQPKKTIVTVNPKTMKITKVEKPADVDIGGKEGDQMEDTVEKPRFDVDDNDNMTGIFGRVITTPSDDMMEEDDNETCYEWVDVNSDEDSDSDENDSDEERDNEIYDVTDVEKVLEEHRLGNFLKKLVELGVTCVEDLADITSDDMKDLGMSKIQQNRFSKMISANKLEQPSNSSDAGSSSASNNVQSSKSESINGDRFCLKQSSSDYTLKYQTQHQLLHGSPQKLTNLDPCKTTLKDLISIIVKGEGCTAEHSVELYTSEGMPLTNDAYLATLSLSKRCIPSGSTIFAIICKADIKDSAAAVQATSSSASANLASGKHVLNCCLVTGEHYRVPLNLDEDTAKDVKAKLAELSGIPESVQILKLQKAETFHLNESTALAESNVESEDWVNVFFFQPQEFDSSEWQDNFTCEVEPYIEQTPKGMGFFAATLYVVASKILKKGNDGHNLMGCLRRLTCMPPLVAALSVLSHRSSLSCAHKIAIVEGLYLLFRRILPKAQEQGPIGGDLVYVPDDCVFEYSNLCWMYLIKAAKPTDAASEIYNEVRFKCAHSGDTLIEPVTVSGLPGLCFNRSEVLKCIKEKKEINGRRVTNPNWVHPCLQMQKLLLSSLTEDGLMFGMLKCNIWNADAKVMNKRPDFIETMHINNFRKEEKDGLCKGLELHSPLNLDEYYLITVNEKREYVVYTGVTKAPGCPVQLYNPATMENECVDKHKLAEKLEGFDFKQAIDGSSNTITRTPLEAIVVVLDVSKSMIGQCFDSNMSKLHAAKELFYAFADRSMAYNLQHIIGLTTFSTTVHDINKCSELYETFKKLVEGVEVHHGTALYDAICEAASQLSVIKSEYPDCKRRIICLTDGIDLHSKKTAVEATKRLQEVGCVLDAVQLFSDDDLASLHGSKNVHIIKSMAHASGGCCFKPASLSEGRKVFEMETVLSIRTRKAQPAAAARKKIASKMDLDSLARVPWTKEPPFETPKALNKPAANTHAVLVKAAQNTRVHITKDRNKRLLREMAAFHREPHPAFSIYPSESHMDFWKLLMVGPTDTPYEGGVFSLYAEFPSNYPEAPPTVRFVTPIYHCNINSIGRICHGIFDRNYTSDLNIKTILSCVFGLLMTPEPRDPLDGVLAEEYFTSRDKYNQKAKEWTKGHAGMSLEHKEKEILESSTLPKRSMPSHLVCPLTKQLFVDPVQTPYGHVYERHAIEAALNKLPADPQEEKPLIKADLSPATNVRRQATDFRESLAKVAACWLN